MLRVVSLARTFSVVEISRYCHERAGTGCDNPPTADKHSQAACKECIQEADLHGGSAVSQHLNLHTMGLRGPFDQPSAARTALQPSGLALATTSTFTAKTFENGYAHECFQLLVPGSAPPA